MKKHIQLLFLFTILTGVNQLTFGVTAYPYPVEIIQPDGTKITIILKGDEHINWAQTVDGYTIMRGSKGIYEYAVTNLKNEMTPSGIKVRNQSERSSSDIQFLRKIEKGLIYSKSQAGKLKSMSIINQKSSEKSFQAKGSRKLLCILIGFTDKEFTKTKADFEKLFNQAGYANDNATGSVYDFYKENSFNQLDLSVTVAGPFTAAHNMAYYGANDDGNDVNPRELVREAILQADPFVNYADFDNDGDGTVDGVYVIYAGYGEEAGASRDAIWAHAWDISPLTLDGKIVDKYSCSPELRGNNGTGITRIGVICHEFGHLMGAADFYDTCYSGNEGTGNWDVMGGGTWNNGGATPAHHNPYTKIYVYGWTTASTLTTGRMITLSDAEQNNNSFYRVNTTTPNEFYLIENRQQQKFDSYIPGHGMIIYHVDKNYVDFEDNTINVGSHQAMYPVCANAAGNPPAKYGNINSGGLPFPGSSNKTSFTDATTPNFLSWAGANCYKPIENITENNIVKTVSFNFMGGVPCTPPTLQSATFSASGLADNSMTIAWTRGNGNAVLVVAKEGSPVDELPETITPYTANTAFGSGDQIGIGNYVIYNGQGNSVSLRSLKSGTAYYYAIYEYASSSNCYLTPPLSGNDATTGIPPYCSAGSKSTDIGYISRVRLNEIDQTSTLGTNGYEDYTSNVATMEIGANSTITINRSAVYPKDSVLIWVDWNRNGDFSDPGENVYSSSTSSDSYSKSFAPPVGSTIGSTVMRLRLQNNTYSPNSTPCGKSYYGEVEDYTINVKPCTPPPVPTIEAIVQPTCTTATGSVILSGLPSMGTWTLTRTPGGITTTGTGITTTLSGLVSGTYTFTVTNVSECTSTASSGVVINAQPTIPAVPVSKAATNILQTSFTVSFTNSSTATSYRLDLANDSGFNTFVTGYNDRDIGNVTTYHIIGLIANTTYYYRVRALNLCGASASFGATTTTTLTNPPAAPTGLTVSSCNNLVTLKWIKNTDPYVLFYRIYGGIINNPTTKIDSTSNEISETSKVISGLTNGQTYYFRITAVNYDGPESPYSSQLSVIVKTGVVPEIKAKWGDVLICYNLGNLITNYQWYKGSTAISNASNQYYSTGKLSGIYMVETTDKEGCKNISNTISITGVSALSAYPNPASVNFTLKLNDASEGRAVVSLLNSKGIKVMEFQTEKLSNELILKEIPVSNLAPGIYVIQVLMNQTDSYTTKIIIKK